MFKIFKLLISTTTILVIINLFAPLALSMSWSDPWPQIQQRLEAQQHVFSLHQQVPLSQADVAKDYTQAKSYIAVDMDTGEILAEKNSSISLPIASLTKIMSAIVVLDLMKPSDEIIISQEASRMPPTKIGVTPGEKMTVDELLHAMLMTSANDAAQAVADGVNGTYHENIFIAAMNEKAKLLGLSQTHFTNPEGFDVGNNISSAHDLVILSVYALSHYPLLAQIVHKAYMQLPSGHLHKQFDLYNWNGLLGVYPGVDGMKIGNTQAAGYTTIIDAIRDNHHILVVLLGAPGILERDLWTSHLLDDVFGHFGSAKITITASDLQMKYNSWQYWN